MTVAVLSGSSIPPEPPDPPDTPDPGHVPTRVYQLRRDDELVATLKGVGTRSRRRNGIGELTVTASVIPAIEPAAEHLFEDGKLKAWRTDRLEIWVLREGVLVWQGPIVSGEVDWQAATVELRAWTREAHIDRLINGMTEPAERFPQGHFDASLTGWTSYNGSVSSASTSIFYRDPRSMRLTGPPGSYEESWVYIQGEQFRNELHWAFTVRSIGAGWPDLGDGPLVALVTLFIDGENRGDWPVLLDTNQAPADVNWPRMLLVLPQVENVLNSYRVRAYGVTSGSGYFGEITAVRNANISSRAGWDQATFAAATLQHAVERLNEGPGLEWSQYVTDSAVFFSAPRREPWVDHGDLASFLTDLNGEWRVELGTRTARWAPSLGRDVTEYTLDPSTVAGLRVEWDDTAASNRAVAYADGEGQEGPTREEGFASASTDGAVLHAAIPAPPGSDVRDLEGAAEEYLNTGGETTVRVTADPVTGVSAGGLPGELQHIIHPGDRVPLVGEVGVVSVDEVAMVEEIAVDDLTDEVSFEVSIL